MKKILLLSGGLDSVTMLHDLRSSHEAADIHCICYNYHQRHAQELLWAKHHAGLCGVSYQTIELPDLGGMTEQSWIVPNRNDVFLAVATNFACSEGAESVLIGCNADDTEFPDCSPEFIAAKNECNRTAGYSVKIVAPYITYTKRQIAEIGKRLGISRTDLWTCYAPTSSGCCGTCPACIKLEKAFA